MGDCVTDKKTDAWMPLWIGAYLADTQMLTTCQHGAYLLLLMAYWRERSALPDDDDALRSIAKADKAEWKKLRPTLVRFFKVDAGVWWHKRVEAEIAEADKRKTSAVTKAQAGGRALAELRRKQAEEDALSIASGSASSTLRAVPQGVLGECPTPSPIPLPPEEREEPTALVVGTAYRLPAVPSIEIVELYRKNLPQLPGVDVLNASRKKVIAARWREVCTDSKFDRAQGLDWFDWFFGHVAKSKFLTGRIPGKDWRADLDFLMTASKFPRVIEGTYHKDAA